MACAYIRRGWLIKHDLYQREGAYAGAIIICIANCAQSVCSIGFGCYIYILHVNLSSYVILKKS